jgi:hypothetical protein
MHGDTIANQRSTFGVRGVSSPNNKPGARRDGYTWADNSGNLWLFGGEGLCWYQFGAPE